MGALGLFILFVLFCLCLTDVQRPWQRRREAEALGGVAREGPGEASLCPAEGLQPRLRSGDPAL